jgi:hypothetical protein
VLTWDPPNERYFHQGLDRGAIYIGDNPPVAWNGLTEVVEGGSSNSEIIYRDGKIILADMDASDFQASVNAVFFPDELSTCLGIPEATDQLYVDNQKPKRFNLSYRTLVGNGANGNLFGYQIHLVYNCLASIGSRSRRTLSDSPEMMPFTFDLVCTPVKLPGFRPSAHYIIDTRGMQAGQLKELEDLLYGKGPTPGRFPTISELFELMNFGVIMRVYDNGDGTYKITGAAQYFTDNGNGSYTVTNINAVLDGDEYAISDGDNTVIVT